MKSPESISMSGKAEAARSKSMSSLAVGLWSDVENSLPSISASLERKSLIVGCK